MKSSENIKETVRNKYAEIAKKTDDNSGCCGPVSCCGTDNQILEYSVMQDDYSNIAGYEKDADLGLGCGIPTEFAGIKIGDTVVDLGSGAGNDIFVARPLVGKTGNLIGIDFTDEMLEKANKNKEKLGAENVQFKKGEIENLPLDENIADVIISNCVLNLVPNKNKAFAEIYRTLKPGGHFCVSDIVIKGNLPEKLKSSAEMYAGCVSGAIQQVEYVEIIKSVGFADIEIKKTKVIDLPDEILKEYLNDEEIKTFRENSIGIFSITIVGYKHDK